VLRKFGVAMSFEEMQLSGVPQEKMAVEICHLTGSESDWSLLLRIVYSIVAFADIGTKFLNGLLDNSLFKG